MAKKLTTKQQIGTALNFLLGQKDLSVVIFVMAITVHVNWLLDTYILKDVALAWLGPEYAAYYLRFLSAIMFMTTIATRV